VNQRQACGERALFKGLGNLAQFGSIVKQAQEMSSRLQSVGDALKEKRVTGTAGGGLVVVETNGLGEVLAVRIDPSLVDEGDREIIEDLLPAAFNQANAKVKQLHSDAMQSVTQAIDLPGLRELVERLTRMGSV
jgi:hypothetical protein